MKWKPFLIMMLLQNLGLVLDDTIKISQVLKAVKDPEEK